MKAREVLSLLAWIVGSNLAGLAGAVASFSTPEFYQTLDRPPFAPPPAVFGPVWTLLYTLMGIAAWMIWRSPAGAPGRRSALTLFGAQLVANAAWSWIFFRWHLGAVAFAEILALLGLIVATAFAFGRIRRAAGWLLVPYIAWVAFAAALTFSIWRRNPGIL